MVDLRAGEVVSRIYIQLVSETVPNSSGRGPLFAQVVISSGINRDYLGIRAYLCSNLTYRAEFVVVSGDPPHGRIPAAA